MRARHPENGQNAAVLSRLLATLAGLVFAYAGIDTLRILFVEDRLWREIPWVALFAACTIVGVAVWPRSAGRGGEGRFLTLLLAAFLVSRLAWVLLVPTVPIWDLLSYFQLAEHFAAGRPMGELLSHEWALYFSAWGYPLALGAVFAVVGKSVLVAKLVNVVAGGTTVLLLYRLAGRLCGRRAARVAALFFALWPAQLMLSSVLVSEHLGVMALLAALLAVLTAMEARRRAAVWLVLAGVLLAVAFSIRSALLVALIAAVVALAIAARSWRSAVVGSVVVVASFAATYAAFLGSIALVYGVHPRMQGWPQLFVGANADSRGMWNEEDFQDLMAQGSVDDAVAYARSQALGRIAAAPLGYGALMAKKVADLWGNDRYGVYWSLLELAPTPASAAARAHEELLNVVSQTFHVAMLLFGVLGCAHLARHRPSAGLAMLLLLVLGGTLVHAVLENQSRYHFSFEPALLVVAAIGVTALQPKRAAG